MTSWMANVNYVVVDFIEHGCLFDQATGAE